MLESETLESEMLESEMLESIVRAVDSLVLNIFSWVDILTMY